MIKIVIGAKKQGNQWLGAIIENGKIQDATSPISQNDFIVWALDRVLMNGDQFTIEITEVDSTPAPAAVAVPK